jgi:hypothetical protein
MQRCEHALVFALTIGCGPDVESTDDVYPRNCGVEGPVDLFELEPVVDFDAWSHTVRFGERYLVAHTPDPNTLEYWSVDRCGEERVLLRSVSSELDVRLGVAGEHLLSCDERTGAVAWVDPMGEQPDHVVFEAAEKCRVVRFGQGLAAQEKEGNTVWLHPDPADPAREAIVVTDAARTSEPDDILCFSWELECKSYHPFGFDISAAGEELLVPLADEGLLAYSSTSGASRIFDAGPVSAVDVLEDDRHVVVGRHLGPTFVRDRVSGDAFELCCYDDTWPIKRLGDWVVRGNGGQPIIPGPSTWTAFRARTLRTGDAFEIEGGESWTPFALLTRDTVLVDISGDAEGRYAVWPATGERRRVDLPGDRTWSWTLPGRDGVFASDENILRHLAGPDEPTRTLTQNVYVPFPTLAGRVVLHEPVDFPATGRLSVMLPDESIVEIDPRVRGVFDIHAVWPIDTDEVVYLAEVGGRLVVRRTVLP